MKIIHINGAGSWGGNEQQLADLIPELEKLQVHNLVLGRGDSPLQAYCNEHDIQFLAAKNGKLTKRPNFRYLKAIVQTEKPDVIHLHTSDSVTLYVISDILFRLRVPTVFSKKGISNSMTFLSIWKYNYKNIDRIICVSDAVKSYMERDVIKSRNKGKLEVIYDGINTHRLTPIRNESVRKLFNIAENKFLIGNIANHAAAKDLDTLLRAMHHLVHILDMKNVHLVQMGKSSKLTPALKEQIFNLDLSDYITLADFQAHATDFLPQFDVYVMSSEREGLPLTVYEAFYKKVPVVSTKAGGIPEVITDSENGYLVDVRDYATLGEKIKILLEDKKQQESFKEKSYDLLNREFTAERTAQHMKGLYKNVLTERN